MRIAGRKLHQWVPPAARPLAHDLSLEMTRARYFARYLALRARTAVGRGVQHVHGPTQFDVSPHDMVVLCLVRNGSAHLPTFIPYYQRLGARHIVLVDNGSTDDTMAIARGHANVTIYRTALPFAGYQSAVKRWLAERFAGRGWALVADADELFDYPFSSRLPLRGFLEYLRKNGYDAVTAQNLEMVPREPISALSRRASGTLEESHRFYDLTDIRTVTDSFWLRRNRIDGDGMYSHSGGVWETVFGYGGSMLTKQPLFRPGSLAIFPYNVHFVTGANIADVTAVFRHYKYTGRFIAHVKEELERKQYYGKAEIFQYYRRALDQNPDLSLYRSTSREYAAAEELLESGFLIASDRYREWVRRYGD